MICGCCGVRDVEGGGPQTTICLRCEVQPHRCEADPDYEEGEMATETVELTAEQSEQCEKWWNSLGAQDQILAAMRVEAGDYREGSIESALIYAAEKPWKWREEAWLAQHCVMGAN